MAPHASVRRMIDNASKSNDFVSRLQRLTEALLTYLDDGHASDWLRSQKYTLDFIDYCLRLL